ncbi:MAG: hypothetical protein AAF620_04840 [Bacteroidota bacterium]
MLSNSLRPIEYFRLKAYYGNTYLLHDDFYDEDGTATQPKQSLGIFKGKSFPKLNELQSLKDLIDYAIVSWEIEKSLKEKFRKFSHAEIEDELSKLLANRPFLKFDIIRVASKVIKGTSSPFVKSLWTNREDDDSLVEFAELLANSFSGDEGVLEYLAELDKIDSEKNLNEQVRGLMYFQSSRIIDWIEYSSDKIKNIPDAWGTVSALSEISWSTIQKWIDKGRPLSLMAIDALAEYATDQDTLNRSPLSRERITGLPEPPDNDTLLQVINNYMEIDGVTRVKQRIRHIESNIDKITRRKSG